MPELIGETEVFCHACRTPHPARHVLEGGKVLGIVDCPRRPWQTTLSDHAELFLQFRQAAHFDPAFRAPVRRPYYFHYLSITDACNCRCPVCFADADPARSNSCLSIADADQVATAALAHGVKTVVFIGGEPTIHPQLFELIAVFIRAGLSVWIATNGLEIARTPEMAKQLKRAGVAKICLQFDTFDKKTLLALRVHQETEAKMAAARAISEAGLILGLVCTVTAGNLDELPSLCRTVLAWPHPPQTIAIQAVAQHGRLTTDNASQISREDIVASLVAGESIPGLANRDFWPIPVCAPLSIFVHPDCAANTVAVVTASGVATTLSRYIDLDRFLTGVSRLPANVTLPAAYGRLALLILRSLRRRGVSLLLGHLCARLRGRQGVRLCLIGTGAFLRRDFHDLGRLARCASGVLSGTECEALCRHYGRQPFAASKHMNDKEAV